MNRFYMINYKKGEILYTDFFECKTWECLSKQIEHIMVKWNDYDMRNYGVFEFNSKKEQQEHMNMYKYVEIGTYQYSYINKEN